MAEGRNQYAPMQGVALLRQRLAEKTRRLYGAGYDPETEITITSGANRTMLRIGRIQAPFTLKKGEDLTLRVFIDKSVVEVFANGKQCVALRVYPGRSDSLGVSLRAQGGDAKLLSLDAWQMENIYE